MTKKLHKELAIRSKAGGVPDDDQLAAINEWTLDQLGAEDVVVREFYLAHNAIDRDRDVFDPELLQAFARTLPGKGFFIKHPNSFDGDSGPGEGIWFAASVEEYSHAEARRLMKSPNLRWVNEDKRAFVLHASAYLVKTPENESLLKKMGAGIARYVSIGFTAADRQPVTDGDNNVIAYRLLPPGEAYEGSMVWLGAQPGAQAYKQARIFDTDPPDDSGEGKTMDFEKELKTLQTEHDNLQETIKKATGAKSVDKALEHIQAAQEAADHYKALTDAFGEEAKEMLGDPEHLKALADAGQQYRGKLLDELVNAERVKGLIEGDDEKALKDAKAGYADLPLPKLRALHASMTKDLDEQQLAGGEANPTKADPHEQDKAPEPPSGERKRWSLPGFSRAG